MSGRLLAFRPGERIDRARLPRLPDPDFRAEIEREMGQGGVLIALFGVPEGNGVARLAVLGDESDGRLLAAMAE